ncbi:hypothetical protein MKW92_016560 [Papaver armeniacum]|nr:hypothetical protein MKW92_016560 [Papaver armeniacum]
MQCFLTDADVKEQQGNERARNWVVEIRNLAYDAEDVIDTFILKVNSTRKTKGIKKFIVRKSLMVKNLIHLHRVGNEILAIQARLKSISKSTITYGIKDLSDKETSSSESIQMRIQHPLRNFYPHVEDNDVIGFEEHTETLLTELMKDNEERRVVSVVGVGGLGKTTLAKKIYRHPIITSHFDCCGWSSISQQLDVKEALGEIAKRCMNLSDKEFEKIKVLNERDLRYFIVLDDVWKSYHWNSLSPAFPTGKRGSKVLLTTRNKEVALRADPESLHLEPQLLNDEESLELLCRKVFPRDMVKVGCYPQGLKELGREMVRKCGGLPLGICVLGGLLATKRSEIKEWELVRRDVISYINRGDDGELNAILALSYYDLPSHLKPCFLYLGLFPEDYAISRKKLIQYWIAEGFIPHADEKSLLTMEDIAEHQYLAELNRRCMIQLGRGLIPSKNRIGGICLVHDLIRDLCLLKAKEIDFLNIYNLQHPVTTDGCRRMRRYAAHLNNPKSSKRYELCFNQSDCAIRTLIFVARSEFLLKPINYGKFKLLRVLDLQEVQGHKTNITKVVSKLIHLRYLNLGDLYGISVSSSIGSLRSLQTLKLYRYKGALPETTSKLVQLRHLFLYGLVDKKFRIENLINLQTIDCIDAEEWIRKGCLEKISNLRKLDVRDTSRLQTDIILEEIVAKSSLSSSSSSSFVDQYQNPIRSLRISTREGFPNSIFESLSCCHNLHTLDLDGKLDIVNLKKYLPNLTKLNLGQSVFKEDPMGILQYLPKLRKLSLHVCVYGGDMVCSSKGFPQLQYFEMYGISAKEWRVDRGGMPHLEELCIRFCYNLSMLPEGLRFITSLEILKIIETPLVEKRLLAGEDWYKIQHVPFIISRAAQNRT